MSEFNLVVRLQNYNRVSFGAILGALSENVIDRFNIIPWVSTSEAPEQLKQPQTLLAYSFMLPHVIEVGTELTTIKATYAKLETVCGGAQPTSAPKQALQMGFDYVIAGEGEVCFAEFLMAWLDNKVEKGIHKAARAQVNLDLYPGFSPITEYLPPIEISRGCICGCMFCGVPRLNAASVRHRSLEAIEAIIKEYFRLKPSRKRIKFLAPNAFAYGSHEKSPNLKTLYDLLEMLKKVGVPEINLGSFPSEVRPDFVTREVMELVTPYLSNKTIVMGVQSGSDSMLKKMNRGHSRAQAVNAISLLREFGFLPHVDFIIGNPDETENDQFELVDFMEQMIKEFAIKVHMHVFTPLPATPWESKPQTAINEQVKQRLRQLERGGKLDGWWENHIGYYRDSSR